MTTLLNNIEGKGAIMKQKILGLCINDGDFSIAEFSKELNASIPTVTRLIGELIEDGFLEEDQKSTRLKPGTPRNRVFRNAH